MSAEELPNTDSLHLLEVAEQQRKILIRIWYAESYAQYLVGMIGEQTYNARASVAGYDLYPDDMLRVEAEVEELIFADVALQALHFASFRRLGTAMERRYGAEELLERYLNDDITWKG